MILKNAPFEALRALTLVAAASVALTTLARASDAVSLNDPRKVLELQAGDYMALSSQHKPTAEDVICADGAVSTVAWSKDKTNPVLMIGERLIFSDFNHGLKVDTQPYYQDHCTYNHSTQTLPHKLIHDLYVTCDTSASTEHTEIQVNGAGLDYSFQRTVSKKNSASTATTTSCKLERKP